MNKTKPTSLFQGAYGIALSTAMVFGNDATYIIDDVDNLGVLRGYTDVNEFDITRRFTYNKNGWTNCRPLFSFVPDGIFHPNLKSANFKELDCLIPLKLFSKKENLTVNEFIRQKSKQYNVYTIYGPDKAICSMPLKKGLKSKIKEINTLHKKAIINSLPRYSGHTNKAIERLNKLIYLEESVKDLNRYTASILKRAVKLKQHSEINVYTLSEQLKGNQPKLLNHFLELDKKYVEIYNESAKIQGSKIIENLSSIPFYHINLKSGERLIPIKKSNIKTKNHIIVPKILVMDKMPDLIYSYAVKDKSFITARAHCFKKLKLKSSQYFPKYNWLEALFKNKTQVRVPKAYHNLIHKEVMEVGSLLKKMFWYKNQFQALIEETKLSNKKVVNTTAKFYGYSLDEIWQMWLINSTLKEIELSHYPLLFYSIFGDDWLKDLHVVEDKKGE